MSKPRPYRRKVYEWPDAYICAQCERERRTHGRAARFVPRVAATKRIFAGVTAYAGNTPTCERHFPAALERELRSMVETWATGRFHHEYRVSVREVRVDEANVPYVGRLILTASPRSLTTRSASS